MLMRREDVPTLARPRHTTSFNLSNWLDDIFEDAFHWTEGRFVPELNVYETAKMFEVTVELPGMDKKDFDISLNDNVLTISGERRSYRNGEEDGRRYHRIESRFGRFSRSLPLPNVVDIDKIKATYENGVLVISLPKLKEKAGRKIEIS
jgi:HSP20 family protein